MSSIPTTTFNVSHRFPFCIFIFVCFFGGSKPGGVQGLFLAGLRAPKVVPGIETGLLYLLTAGLFRNLSFLL